MDSKEGYLCILSNEVLLMFPLLTSSEIMSVQEWHPIQPAATQIKSTGPSETYSSKIEG